MPTSSQETGLHADANINKGLELLRPLLLPGEEYISYAVAGISEIERDLPHFRRHTAAERVIEYLESGEFQSVRIVPVAFSNSGDIIRGYASIVGVRKPIPTQP